MASTLRQRSVVSSFICKPEYPHEGFKVAIFKRSQDVSTYKGKWAACSGSIETTDQSPEEAAKREIQEETTLTDEDITLFHRGKPFALIDEGLKTEWTIYPFTWMMKEGARDIKFDWEHTEYAFIYPEDLKNYDTVPNLDFGLGRCLVGPETQKSLDALKNDHQSGAQEMAANALNMLLEISRNDLAHITNTKEFWKEWRMAAWHLAKNGRPSMGAALEAALLRALTKIRLESRSSAGTADISALSDLDALKTVAQSVVHQEIADGKHSLEALGKSFVQFVVENSGEIGEGTSPSNITIVTLSASGTIKQCLVDLIWSFVSNGKSIKLCILESRPKFEGATFASNLLDTLEATQKEGAYRKLESLFTNLKIEIVSDATVATVVKHADYVIIGADKILADGDTSNKIGSLTAVIMAKILNPACKVVAVFQTDKITGGENTEHFKVEYNDAAEVTGAWELSVATRLAVQKEKGFRVEIRNAYFEWVPAKYIDAYISEQGVLCVEDIKKLSAEGEEREKSIFGDV